MIVMTFPNSGQGRWAMSAAAFNVTKWRKYRSTMIYGGTMESMIDMDLKHHNPPSSETIVELMLLGDKQYMTSMLTKHPLLKPSHGRMSIAAISHDLTHPFHKRIKNAFGYANSRRKKAGLVLDKWPIPIVPPPPPIPIPSFVRAKKVRPPPPHSNRRLLWNRSILEIKEAHRLFRRFSREGMIPFSVGSDGEPISRIYTFNPRAGEIIFQIAGD